MLQTRTRMCIGGIPGLPGCLGTANQLRSCQNQPACPAWSDWGGFNACSATCGGGLQVRTR